MAVTGVRALDELALDSTFLAEEHRALRAALRTVIAAEIVPNADQWELDRRVPAETFRRLGCVGLLGLSFPNEMGGGAAGVRGAVVLNEEFGRSTYGGVAASVTTHSDMSSLHLARVGTPEQIARWAPGVIAGTTITGLGVTEPEASSDLTRLAVRARRDGDVYVLDGIKTFITHANIGDLFFVVARTGEPGRNGLSLLAVERGTPGFANGRVFHKTGWRSADTGELVFSDCRIPVENRLGDEGDGVRLLMASLDHERICLVAKSIGLGEATLAYTLE